jgi:catechol 2,3-dioxygenase-like lactoylglutathione lyase family enzyme
MDPKLAVIALWAEDVAEAAHFYRDVIGLRPMPHHGEWPHFNLGGIFLTILQGRPSPAEDALPSRFPILALSVGNLQDAIALLDANAVEMPWGIKENANSRWVLFHDPAGNLIELVEFN